MDETIQIALAADATYKRQLAVTLCSLAAAQQQSECSCAVTVLHDGISASDRSRITACVRDRVGISWLQVDEGRTKGLHYSGSVSTMFRLLLPDLLPEADRVIYLDSDTVILSALDDLWKHDLGESLLGAVRDAASPWAAGLGMTHWRDLGLDPGTAYFNAGVMVIPLATWRKEEVGQAALAKVRKASFVYEDQDALNAVAGGNWLQLPRRWNVQTADMLGQTAGWALMRAEIEAALADPAIIHYTRPAKPWWIGSVNPRADLWFRYLDQTPWAGWRPPARRSLLREAAYRAKHASRTVVSGVRYS